MLAMSFCWSSSDASFSLPRFPVDPLADPGGSVLSEATPWAVGLSPSIRVAERVRSLSALTDRLRSGGELCKAQIDCSDCLILPGELQASQAQGRDPRSEATHPGVANDHLCLCFTCICHRHSFVSVPQHRVSLSPMPRCTCSKLRWVAA